MYTQKDITREFITRNYDKLQSIKNSITIEYEMHRLKTDTLLLDELTSQYKTKIKVDIIQFVCDNSYIDYETVREILEETTLFNL